MEYYVRPTLSTGLTANDNRRLVVLDPESTYKLATEAGFAGYAADDVLKLSLSPRAKLSRYEGDSSLNSDEYWIDSYVERLFRRWRVSVDAGYSDVATVTSELDDSGNLRANARKKSYYLGPAASFFVSPQTVFSLSGSANTNKFVGGGGFIDYDFLAASANLRHQFNPRTAWTVTLTKTIFEPEIDTRNDTYSFEAGIEHALDESIDVTARIGFLRSTIEFQMAQPIFLPGQGILFRNVKREVNDGGALINFGATKRFPTLTLNAEFDRRLSPSSQGRQNKTDDVTGEALWDISEKISSRIAIKYREQNAESDFISGNQLTTYNVYGSLSRRLTSNWRIAARYQYRRQMRSQSGITVDYNELSVALIYRADAAPLGLVRR